MCSVKDVLFTWESLLLCKPVQYHLHQDRVWVAVHKNLGNLSHGKHLQVGHGLHALCRQWIVANGCLQGLGVRLKCLSGLGVNPVSIGSNLPGVGKLTIIKMPSGMHAEHARVPAHLVTCTQGLCVTEANHYFMPIAVESSRWKLRQQVSKCVRTPMYMAHPNLCTSRWCSAAVSLIWFASSVTLGTSDSVPEL